MSKDIITETDEIYKEDSEKPNIGIYEVASCSGCGCHCLLEDVVFLKCTDFYNENDSTREGDEWKKRAEPKWAKSVMIEAFCPRCIDDLATMRKTIDTNGKFEFSE